MNVIDANRFTMADEVAALDAGERVARDIAVLAAKRLIELIRGECERVEIAGSVRRGKEDVKDVEIVAIPKAGDPAGSPLLRRLDGMVANGVIKKAEYGVKRLHRWGDKYRGIEFDGMTIEIFLTDVDGWGYQYWLRTGPGDAGAAFMSVLNARSNYRAIDGHIWHGTKWMKSGEKWESSDRQKMSLPEECDFFGLIGLPVVAPDVRCAQTYQALWNKTHIWGNPTFYKKKVNRVARVDDSRYGMLPTWHPQRNEYECSTPCMWKHNLLPLSIAYYEQRIKEVPGDTFDLVRLLEADRERFREGEEAIAKGTMRE